eukprot:scaffold89484_cov65-Phaeocystis_antarctica.AAC.4
MPGRCSPQLQAPRLTAFSTQGSSLHHLARVAYLRHEHEQCQPDGRAHATRHGGDDVGCHLGPVAGGGRDGQPDEGCAHEEHVHRQEAGGEPAAYRVVAWAHAVCRP